MPHENQQDITTESFASSMRKLNNEKQMIKLDEIMYTKSIMSSLRRAGRFVCTSGRGFATITYST